MIIGYARTSTVNQIAGFEVQIRELEAANCKKIFQEQVSSVAVRVQLQAALEFARESDVLVVPSLTVLGSIAQFEREMMLARQREGPRLRQMGNAKEGNLCRRICDNR